MSKDFRIAPSILSADFSKLGQEIEDVIKSGTDLVHFDVMDNHYVPNLTIGPLVCDAIRDLSHKAGALIDVHLMVKPVDRIIPDFAKAGADIITSILRPLIISTVALRWCASWVVNLAWYLTQQHH